MNSTASPRVGLFWFASPQTFFPLAGKMVPLFSLLAVGLGLVGLYIAFLVAPTDATQGESYRIIFIHVPSAWMSMVLYVVMAFWAAVGLVFNTRLSSMMATAIAPTGALMTFLALWTGAFWGRPTWGAYWVWDARLTSTAFLFITYIGYLAVRRLGGTHRQRARRSAVLALLAILEIPLVHFSVRLWRSLHQEATVATGGTDVHMDGLMLFSLFLGLVTFSAMFVWLLLHRQRGLMLEDTVADRGLDAAIDARRSEATV